MPKFEVNSNLAVQLIEKFVKITFDSSFEGIDGRKEV